MPAMLDDPTAPAIYRVSGAPPFPTPYGLLPEDIGLRQVTLRDRATIATLVPFSSPHQVPHKLTAYLCELLNREIEKGDTYPMTDPMPLSSFGPYWFANFGAIMLLGDVVSVEELHTMEAQNVDWSKECLGSFYVKPNYPGRSSHVCNGGFLVSDAARNKGVGRLMGEQYLDWAPKLGYTYSVFNLVYETNVASLRIWDALGFKRIGRVKGCGNLKSYPDQYIDAIMFGRELGGEGDEYVSEERFDKIRFYLKTGTYPAGSDRAEKSRLRSAATHYRLVPDEPGEDGAEDKLMLKGKEVISDPHKQYEIARNIHNSTHGGINKTTAAIAERYHWVRIKETVSAAIRNCEECKESQPKLSQPISSRRVTKEPSAPPTATTRTTPRHTVTAGEEDGTHTSQSTQPEQQMQLQNQTTSQRQQQQQQQMTLAQAIAGAQQHYQHNYQDQSNQQTPEPSMSHSAYQLQQQLLHPDNAHQQHRMAPVAEMTFSDYGDMPVDPQIMQTMQSWTQHAPQNSQSIVDAMAAGHMGGQSMTQQYGDDHDMDNSDQIGGSSNVLPFGSLQANSSMSMTHSMGDEVKDETSDSLGGVEDTGLDADMDGHDAGNVDDEMMEKRLQQELEAQMMNEQEVYRQALTERNG
ncbi:hypothetical protein B0A50_04010 [Salinomyces thailandicus]|uniref:N-acetyltransferase domain-containing protein n=1 Tax=Salinomyces thailandicus TaxID=706561 RepID=A0A4U0U1G7_9PEZI|nr:hypothetical protein B0A50_04010 [Salinomyces thailandica]